MTDDSRIIELLELRDERALSELRQKFSKSCQSIAYNILGNRLDAEEIVNDAMLHIWNAVPPMHPENLFSFAAAVTKRLSISRVRKEHAEKRGGAVRNQAIFDELAECIPSGQDVEQHTEQRALVEALNRYLSQMQPEARAVVVQRYVRGLSVKEIADMYGFTESKVKMTLSRARRQLKEHLEQEEWI